MARLLVLACTLFGSHAAPTAFPTYADASAEMRFLVLACTLFGGHAAPTAFPTYADSSAECRHSDTPWLGKMIGDKTSLLLIQQDVNQYISFIPTIIPMPPAALGELAGHKALGGYQKAKDRITFQLRALDTMSESGQLGTFLTDLRDRIENGEHDIVNQFMCAAARRYARRRAAAPPRAPRAPRRRAAAHSSAPPSPGTGTTGPPRSASGTATSSATAPRIGCSSGGCRRASAPSSASAATAASSRSSCRRAAASTRRTSCSRRGRWSTRTACRATACRSSPR